MKIKKGEYLYPKGNAFFERFNRSLQEDFVDYREEELRDDLEGFNRELMEYLIWCYYGEDPCWSGRTHTHT